eukprot:8387285-Lingulodinium_polyedra.AAC.1
MTQRFGRSLGVGCSALKEVHGISVSGAYATDTLATVLIDPPDVGKGADVGPPPALRSRGVRGGRRVAHASS